MGDAPSTEDINNAFESVFDEVENAANQAAEDFEDYYFIVPDNGSGPFRRLSNGERRAASAVQSNLGRGRGGD